MTGESRDFDAVIVGGGLAGCATALAIARNDPSTALRVLLLDNADATAYKIGESLPASAKRTLSNLHPSLMARLAQDTVQGLHGVCTGNASAWASAHLQETYSLMNPYGAGWHLDRALFDETLREACGPVLRKGRFLAVRRVDGDTSYGWEVDMKLMGTNATETCRARWIVDATGRKASLARKLGAKVHKYADLLSFYALFSQSDPVKADHDDRTVIEAAPSGWWYTARLPHEKRLAMYTTTPTDATARTARTSTGFLDMLHDTTHVARTLRPADADEEIYEMEEGSKFTRHTTACSSMLEPYAAWEPLASSLGEKVDDSLGRGWCAVGDAALAFDPLSSQGMITALNAGAFLGGVLARRLGVVESAGQLDGDSTVRKIKEAYEQVRLRYEQGRAYYYNIVNRFDVGSGNAEDSRAESGDDSFWRKLREESKVEMSSKLSLPIR